MTLKAELAKADAARAYAAGGVLSAEAYRTKALAVQAAQDHAEATQAAADRQASLPVIVGVGNLPTPEQNHDRPVTGPATDSGDTGSAPSAVAALPQTNVDNLLAIEARHDAAGVDALRAEWGNEVGINLGYAQYYLAGHLSDEGWEKAKSIPHMTVPILRLLAELGRAEAHGAPSASITTTNTKGQPMAGETLSRSDAEKKFREATKRGHDLKARGDLMGAREAFAERDRLSEALYPGSTEPDETHKRISASGQRTDRPGMGHAAPG